MRTIINILGTNRSGSTMLDLMLGNDPNAFSCGEVYAWYRPWRTHHFLLECSCGDSDCNHWNTLKKYPEHIFHVAVLNELNVNWVVDSSKNLAWILDIHKWHNKHFRIVNILIWKEPIDLAFSNWKRGQYNIEKNISENQLGLKYLNRLLYLRIPFIAIKYKDLVKNPSKVILEICTKINMPFHEGKELFWMKKHHYLFGSDSVRQQFNNDKPYIYVEENWPQDFTNIVPKLDKEIKEDLELQKVLDEMNSFDIKNVKNYNDLDSTTLKIPFWYHYQKPKRLFQRIFPQSYNVQTIK